MCNQFPHLHLSLSQNAANNYESNITLVKHCNSCCNVPICTYLVIPIRPCDIGRSTPNRFYPWLLTFFCFGVLLPNPRLCKRSLFLLIFSKRRRSYGVGGGSSYDWTSLLFASSAKEFFLVCLFRFCWPSVVFDSDCSLSLTMFFCDNIKDSTAKYAN